jgi:hypothetical protein
MLQTLTLVAALTCGQTLGPPEPASDPLRATLAPLRVAAAGPDAKKADAEEKKEPEQPAAPAAEPQKKAEEPSPAPAPPAGDRWILMKALQGSYPGYVMNNNRIQIWGWTTASYNVSSANVDNNLPVVWDDRADKFLLNQHWTRIEKTLLTNAPSWGWRVDLLAGSDYRWTLPRGLGNSQLLSDTGHQNLYGIDPVAPYVEWYTPNVFQGLDIKAGRFFTPFGYESLETISSPLVSKSYSFNWFPPFTHYGILATAVLNPTWTAQAGIVNGNDVMLGDPSEEARFLGTIRYAAPNKRDVVTFGTSLGRGKMNTGDVFSPATIGLQTEPAGRNNINVFDVVWTHVVNPRVNYAMEVDYGYQYGVPANVFGGIVDTSRQPGQPGFAHWGGIAQYLLVNLSPHLTQITRFELWDDFEGQRTGFEGLYTALTVGAQYRPQPWLMIRPELRYDYNGYSTPFNNGTRHELFTAAMDVTVRW